MVRVGGPLDLVQAAKAAGLTPGPTSYWVGSWNLKSGYGGTDEFLRRARDARLQPLILHWWWGDQISPDAIRRGVHDPYQGVTKTGTQGIEAARTVARKCMAMGLSPLWVIENEFNKAGCADSPDFRAYWLAVASAVRQECPTARIVFAPGAWGDLADLAVKNRALLDASDYLGLQSLAAIGRLQPADYARKPAELESALKAIRTPDTRARTLPCVLYDVGYSSYGGPQVSRTHPFGGGNGEASETLQASTLADLVDRLPRMGVEALVYRSLKDTPTFDVKNYFGYGERHWGLQRPDGRPKAAWEPLLRLKEPTGPTPEDFARVERERDAAVEELQRLQALLAKVRALVN